MFSGEGRLVRRSREEAEETRQALLTTALELFAERGADAVTMKEIATQAGVTHGAMYWHFRNKQHLLTQVHQQTLIPFEPHYLEQRQAVQQDALGALEGFIRGSLRALAEDPQAQQAYRLFHYGRRSSPALQPLSEQLDAEVESWQAYLHYFLKQAKKQKQLRKKLDLDQISASLLISLVGALDLWLTMPQRYDLRLLTDYLIAIDLEGLRSLKKSMV